MRAVAVRKAKADEIKNKMATKIQAAWRAGSRGIWPLFKPLWKPLRRGGEGRRRAHPGMRWSAGGTSRATSCSGSAKRNGCWSCRASRGLDPTDITRPLRADGLGGRAAPLTLQDRAAPLYSRLNVLLDESSPTPTRATTRPRPAEAQVEVTQIEARATGSCRGVGHDTWDTGRLSQGYVQRYKTSFLKHRIIELLANKRAATSSSPTWRAKKLLWPGTRHD